MDPNLKISSVTERYIREALQRNALTAYDFRTWRSELEFLLSTDGEECLARVHVNEGWIHERKERKIVGGRAFEVIWEIECDRKGDCFLLLDFQIVAVPPEHSASAPQQP